MTRLVRDARFAVRLFSRAPAFASLAIVVLALGISSTTAIFSVVWFLGLAMTGMVHGVQGFDPVAFAIVASTLLGSALVACLVPARRAASVDPIVALRRD